MSGLRALVRFYLATMRQALQTQFQYRAANYFYMIGMIAEPIIYLVVWQTIAGDGSVAGYDAGGFAAYYIIWTLVRNMNIVFTPYGWEWRIRSGQLSGLLLKPLHPLHYDLAYFAGWKFVVIVLWLPLALLLSLLFRPTFDVTLLEGAVFFAAIWGAYLIRSLLLWLLGLLSFWTTRVAAIYELYFALELLLSGRLVPLALLPEPVRQLSPWLPFSSTFGFPIDVIAGQLTPAQLLSGLLTQLAWIGVAALLVQLVWRRAVRRYSAVGG